MNALKVECEKQLSSLLTTESVCSYLMYADMHNASTLKENCFQFMTLYSSEVMSSNNAAWQQFEKSARSDMLLELLRRVSSNKF